MYHITNVREWLREAVQKCNENKLDPGKAVFMFVLFSSLDFEYVSFFKNKSEQISSYAGENFHILTPIVYHNSLVPDHECRSLRLRFSEAGIPLGNTPCALFFYVTETNRRYKPVFFAAHDLPSFSAFKKSLRHIIDTTLEYISEEEEAFKDSERLLAYLMRLEERLLTPNIIKQPVIPDNDITRTIERELSVGKVFISYASGDRTFVTKLMDALTKEKISAWLDENEISAGEPLRSEITSGLRACDALVVVLSPTSVRSDWVKFELAQFLALDNKRRLIPILLGATPKELPAPFDEIQGLKYIDFEDSSSWSASVGQLHQAIEKITNETSNSRSA